MLPARSEEERVARRRETVTKAVAKYRALHREELNAKQEARRKCNLPEQARRLREYRKRRPDRFRDYESRRVRPEGHKEAFNSYRREWALQNRDKQREHAHKRSGLKLGKLPRGTIKAVGAKQSWRCAACGCDLRQNGYHKDHIQALAKGGKHEPSNIQLLCPPCNLRKGTKDDAEFKALHGLSGDCWSALAVGLTAGVAA